MALIKVRGTGVQGISEDMSPSELPLSMFSYGENLVYQDGKIENTPDIEEVLNGVHGDVQWYTLRHNIVTNKVEVIYVSRENNVDNFYIIKEENLGNTDGSEKGVLASRAIPQGDASAYTTIPDDKFWGWNGFNSNGMVLVTNGLDAPQVLAPDSDQFTDLPNWPINLRCKAVAPYKAVWVAMNISDTNSTFNKANMVMWSSPLTDFGAIPSDWEAVDANGTTGAGFNYLTDTGGAIMTGKMLNDAFLIYKTDSVVRVDYTGVITSPFTFRTIFNNKGIWSSTSLADLGDKHLVVAGADIYITDGITEQSIAEGKIQNELTERIYDNTGTYQVVLAPDHNNNMVYVLVKSSEGATKVTYSYNYNYKSNIWTRRKPIDGFVDYVAFMPVLTPTSSDGLSWNTVGLSWADFDAPVYENTWGAQTIASLIYKTVLVYQGKFFAYARFRARKVGEDFILKKHDIDFDEVQGVDGSFVKQVNAIYPMLTEAKGYLIVKAWGHSKAGEEVPEADKKHYVINMAEDFRVDMRPAGRFISLEFFTDSDIVANWDSYNFQNYIEKPTRQPDVYLDLTGMDYDLSLIQRR